MAAKARLVEVRWNDDQNQYDPVSGGKVIPVHFNPESLKVAYANENRGGNQPSGGGAQYVGNQTSTLTIELLFDTTEPRGETTDPDVRTITRDVSHFIKPLPPDQRSGGGNTSNNRVPPLVSFEWGTFLFRGTVEKLDETLDYFSETGVPMRATISMTIKNQDIIFEFGSPGAAGDALTPSDNPLPGSRPLQNARPGDSMQQMAGRDGRSGDWKSIAAANGIDDPLRLSSGALVDMNAGASIGAGVSVGGGVSAGASASFGAGASAGVGLSAGAQAGFSAGLGGGVGFAAGGGAGASVGGGVGAGASTGAGFSAGASAGTGFGATASAEAGIGSIASGDVSAWLLEE